MPPRKLDYFWAGAAALLFPGAGHLYADRAWTARVLCCGVAVSGLTFALASNAFVVNTSGSAITFTILADLVGAMLAIKRGPVQSTSRQLRAGVVWLAGAITFGALVAVM